MTSFHFVPTLERTTRESALASESSPFVRQRGILCGYFIVVPYSTVNRPETFVAGFAPNRLRHPLPPLDSKTLTSKFRDYAVFVCAVVIVVLTAQLLQTSPRVPKRRTRRRCPINERRIFFAFGVSTLTDYSQLKVAITI